MAISITKPSVGGSTGTWGTELNAALDTIVNGVNQNSTDAAAKIATNTITAKGDLIAGTGAATVARQGIGANGYALIADSSYTTGMAWKLAPGSLMCKLRQTITQTMTTTYTALTWQTIDYDRNGTFGAGGTTYTPGTAGWYELAGGVAFNSVASSYRSCGWAINGTLISGGISSIPSNGGAIPDSLAARTFVVQLGPSDTVSLQGYASGTGGATYATSPHASYMTVKWLGS